MRTGAVRRLAGAACASLAVGCAAATGAAGGAAAGAPAAETAEAEAPGDEVQLLGPLERAEIEAALPDWVAAEMEAEPDAAATLAMLDALPGAEVVVYLGTWCSDSRRELARLWRALDEAGSDSPPEMRLIGVARGLEEPRDLVAGAGLAFVPTFVVRRGGVEVGRIVEISPTGVEHDLLALLNGAAEGVVSGRTDLAPGGVGAADG